MREILFRGKHVHAWVYGYLCDENYINSPDLEGEFLVDPETICQYTGVKDGNGNKIFEGDIIKYNKKLFEIVWVDECAHFAPRPFERLTWSPCMNVGTVEKSEVVGNVFDNPELVRSDA